VLSDLVNEEQELAETFVSELAKVYRYILICEQESLVDLQTEIDFIKSFVFLLKIRFEEKMIVNIEVQDTENKRIAPLTLQLLVENAVKHNIISSEHPLIIRIYQEGDYILVSNNFQVRRDHEMSTGKGLKNIKSRYHFMSDLPVDVVQSEKEFTVKVPLIYKKRKTKNTRSYHESTDY
jgi:two-component system LytT family sensor kinase